MANQQPQPSRSSSRSRRRRRRRLAAARSSAAQAESVRLSSAGKAAPAPPPPPQPSQPWQPWQQQPALKQLCRCAAAAAAAGSPQAARRGLPDAAEAKADQWQVTPDHRCPWRRAPAPYAAATLLAGSRIASPFFLLCSVEWLPGARCTERVRRPGRLGARARSRRAARSGSWRRCQALRRSLRRRSRLCWLARKQSRGFGVDELSEALSRASLGVDHAGGEQVAALPTGPVQGAAVGELWRAAGDELARAADVGTPLDELFLLRYVLSAGGAEGKLDCGKAAAKVAKCLQWRKANLAALRKSIAGEFDPALEVLDFSGRAAGCALRCPPRSSPSLSAHGPLESEKGRARGCRGEGAQRADRNLAPGRPPVARLPRRGVGRPRSRARLSARAHRRARVSAVRAGGRMRPARRLGDSLAPGAPPRARAGRAARSRARGPAAQSEQAAAAAAGRGPPAGL